MCFSRKQCPIAKSRFTAQTLFSSDFAAVSKVLVALSEFIIVFLLFVVLLVFYGMPLSLRSLVLIPVFLGVTSFGFGLALILSALTIRNRDLHHIVPFIRLLWDTADPCFLSVTASWTVARIDLH